MNIIKLNATSSTNDYMKGLLSSQFVENFTVVTTENQTSGRGQMGTSWTAQAGKNLTFSVLVKDLLVELEGIFSLNVAVAVAIAKALETLGMKDIAIKWPNDILAGNKKLGGILIENSIKSSGEIFSIVGIGLNVNQLDFDDLPKATSMALASGKEWDKDAVMQEVLNALRVMVSRFINGDADSIWQEYHAYLFKKDIPAPFEKEGARFMGIIQEVSRKGGLRVLLEDETVTEYGIKEVQLLY